VAFLVLDTMKMNSGFHVDFVMCWVAIVACFVVVAMGECEQEGNACHLAVEDTEAPQQGRRMLQKQEKQFATDMQEIREKLKQIEGDETPSPSQKNEDTGDTTYEKTLKKWKKKENTAIVALLTGLKGQKSAIFGSTAEEMKKTASTYADFKKDVMDIRALEYTVNAGESGDDTWSALERKKQKWTKRKDGKEFVEILESFGKTKQDKWQIPKATFTEAEEGLSGMTKDYLEFAKDLEVIKSEIAAKEAKELAAKKAKELALKKFFEEFYGGKVKKWKKRNNAAIVALLAGLKGQSSKIFGSTAEEMKKNSNAYDEFKKDVMEIRALEYTVNAGESGDDTWSALERKKQKWTKRKDGEGFVEVLESFGKTKQDKWQIPKTTFTEAEEELSRMTKDYLEFAKDLQELQEKLKPIE